MEEITNPTAAPINTLQNASLTVPSSTPTEGPHQHCLTDKQMAFAIASALSAVSNTPDSPAVTLTTEQEQPPKAQRKRHAKKAVITPNLTKLPPNVTSTAQPVKCKRQERVPPNVEPPSKKNKIPLPEPGKRASDR